MTQQPVNNGPPMPAPPVLEVLDASSICVSWQQHAPSTKACAVQLAVAGTKNWHWFDSTTSCLVREGGQAIEASGTTSCVVKGLSAEKAYVARIHVKGPSGWSSASRSSLPATIASPPTPEPPTLQALDASSIRVSWPELVCSPLVTAYAVQLAVAGTDDWYYYDTQASCLVKEGGRGVPGHETSCIVRNLPHSTYRCRIQAHNGVAWSSASSQSDTSQLPRIACEVQDRVCETVGRFGNVAILRDLAELLLKSLPEADAAAETLLHLGERLAPQFSRIFSSCPNYYGERGGLPYYKPRGWVRFAVDAPEECLRDWCVAYHGTSWPRAARILTEGLRSPGSPGVRVAHGQAGSSSQASIYLSPAVGYAAFPVYSTFHELAPDHWAQCVLQVRVRPGSFARQASTLGSEYWPEDLRYDEDFHSRSGLEWLIEDPQDHVVCGLLVREFGAHANADIYGLLATRVKQGNHGPQYEWTDLLKKKFRKKKLFLE